MVDEIKEKLKIAKSVKQFIGMEDKKPPPKDKYYIVYMLHMVYGIGALTGWNMFITAKDYFVKYKLADAPQYAENFLVYVGWAMQIPNLVFSWVNVFIHIGAHGDLGKRMTVSLILQICVFFLTIVLAVIDSSQWPEDFFWCTWISIFCLSSFNAIFQNCTYGLAGPLPPKYTGGIILGANFCGTCVVLINWASDLMSDDYKTSAIYYFSGGALVLALCLSGYMYVSNNAFYRYYSKAADAKPVLQANLPVSKKIPYRAILKQCWEQLYNVFITYFVTLFIFPALHSDIMPNQPGFLSDDFVRVTCFLTFNLLATIGTATSIIWQLPDRRCLFFFTTTRVLFIPFFLFCNYQPRGVTRRMPVVIDNDWLYWFVAVLMSWSHGHYSSLAMMYVGGKVAPEHAKTAGMFGGAMLVTGIFAGITCSIFAPIIVSVKV